MNRLEELAIKYCVDKHYRHSYIPIYSQLLERRTVKRLLEIGIGYEGLMAPFVPKYIHGASLHMWSELFPDAEVWACDIRPDVLVNEGNIHSRVCDQSSGESLATFMFEASEGLTKPFDVIIDDGSHQFEHQWLTFDCFRPRLAKGGLYVIEDTYPDKGAALAAHMGGQLYIGNRTPDDCLAYLEV